MQEIITAVEADINADVLRADKVITDLLSVSVIIPVSEAVVDKAKLRAARGNPPGKKGSLGDAINWESLLEAVPNNEDLTVISSDGDFEAPLPGKRAKEFLIREWRKVNSAELTLYKSLPAFLEIKFPRVEFSDEIAKIKAIGRLELSGSFLETHGIIEQLNKYSDFNEDEIESILNSYFYNSQVRQILRDDDVSEFAWKIVKLADKNTIELAKKLEKKLEEINSG